MRYLDVIPQEYSVDYARRIRTPIGMEGKKLEGSLHVVTAQSAQCLFLNKVIRRTGLELIDSQLIFNPLAAASAVLRPEEIDLGVALIDIGSDLSDVAVFLIRRCSTPRFIRWAVSRSPMRFQLRHTSLKKRPKS